MFEVEEKVKYFFEKDLWERGIQHCIDKGIRPVELYEYATAEFRAQLLDVMLAGRYKVAPPHIARIPKGNGEFREVYVNTVLDRLVLTIINEVLFHFYGGMINPHCVSYQKGIGVKKIIDNIVRQISLLDSKNHGEHAVLGYKIDISKYFDSVSREAMNAALKEVSSGSCIDQILYDYYNDDIIMNADGELEERYKSLCQGCAPSAFFANIMLRDADEAMASICDVYYRYSDDLIIIGERKDEALELLTEILGKKGLKINPKKVEKLYADKWFTFLGCKIKGTDVSLGEKSLKNFTDKIKKIAELPKTKEYRHGCSDEELKKKIKAINHYLYKSRLENPSMFGWADYFFGIINCEDDIVAMDLWLKDLLRGCLTGKCRPKEIGGLGSGDTGMGPKTVFRGKGTAVKSNLQKTGDRILEDGYVSMHHLYKVSRIDRDVYTSEIMKLA